MAIPLEPESNERGSHAGPQSGGYIVLPFTTGEVMVADASLIWKAPFPCKVVHVSADCQATTGGQYSLTTTAGGVIALRTIPTTVEVAHAGAAADVDIDAVAAANRDLAEGDLLTLLLDVGTSITGACVVVTLRVKGHPTAWGVTDD